MTINKKNMIGGNNGCGTKKKQKKKNLMKIHIGEKTKKKL